MDGDTVYWMIDCRDWDNQEMAVHIGKRETSQSIKAGRGLVACGRLLMDEDNVSSSYVDTLEERSTRTRPYHLHPVCPACLKAVL